LFFLVLRPMNLSSFHAFARAFVVCFFLITAIPAFSQTADSPAPDTTEKSFSTRFQETLVDQAHPAFSALYSGRNSLSNGPENNVSVTSTFYFGARLWKGAELYFNPEMTGGTGFTSGTGMAGFPNGEIYRVSNPAPVIFLARLYGSFTFALGNSSAFVDEDENQIAGMKSNDRFVLTLGRFSVTDFFDDNAYSHEPRTQFLNWSLMDNAVWDYPADTRGYTVGAIAELIHPDWALRFAAVMVSTTANGDTLDTRIGEAHAFAFEYEHSYSLGGQPGKIRAFVFENVSQAGTYADAINNPQDSMNVDLTHKYGTIKYGGGIGFEQAFSADLGAFLRAGWSDGQTEAWMFTPIDQSISAGAILKGTGWNRPADAIGLAVVMNGLSQVHAQYLEDGGYDFNIGDGKLNYAPETIVEAYYNAQTWWHPLSVGVDYQFCVNPAYNKDRGPINIFGARAHVEL